MQDPGDLSGISAPRLRRALMLTRAGMLAERLTRAFWPLASLVLAVLAALMFGLQDQLPLELFWILAVSVVLGGLAALALGLRRFRLPTRAEAAGRVDATLPGRPIQALADRQAVGAGDAASVAVWRAHLARMSDRVNGARAVAPDLRVASRDPYALRYVALIAFVMALIFGSVWRVASVAELGPVAGGGPAAAEASWEGWIEPPRYTGRPSIYLADIPPGVIRVPEGALVTIRLYGATGQLIVDETVSGRTGEIPGASEPVQSFAVTRAGSLSIRGPGGRDWSVEVLPDEAPVIAPKGAAERTAKGEMRMGFTAEDDFGVEGARARIELDLARADRRHGLAIDPEPREAISIDLPLRGARDRRRIDQIFTEDLSEHPWAHLPVRITLTAWDAAAQEGSSAPTEILLPGRRFFDTMAAALVENRRDLLWNRENALRVTRVLRAVSWQPETGFNQPGIYLKLRTVIRRIEAELEKGPLGDEFRDEVAAVLWSIALEIEDGTLENALERMREAQRRLSEAIRNGATPEEIARLMDELRRATDEYVQMLAEQAPDGTDTPQQGPQGEMISGDQIAEMMRQLQELMEQGRTAEAQALLEQLQQLLENMQVTRGGQGGGGPGEQAMEGLGDALREQQELSDDTFGDLNQRGAGRDRAGERQGRPGRRGGERGQPEGPPQGEGQEQGENGAPGTGEDQRSLAERQRALREMIEGQRDRMPGSGTPEGDAARDALDRAGRAMDEAAEALGRGDLGSALDDQAEAMEALRDGMRRLGEMAARERQPGEGQEGNDFGQLNGPNGSRDPLGREATGDGSLRTDGALLQGEDVYRRARELLEELRRRAGEQGRGREELDYLRRLLERF